MIMLAGKTVKFKNLIPKRINIRTVLNESWNQLLGDSFIKSRYFHLLMLYINNSYGNQMLNSSCEPSEQSSIFKPFKESVASEIKCVIIGHKPAEHSSGILFGVTPEATTSYNVERHDLRLRGKNPEVDSFDRSLLEWIEKGILGINYTPFDRPDYLESPTTLPLQKKLKLYSHADVFKAFYINVLHKLYLKNPNLIIAITNNVHMDIVRLAGIPNDNVVRGAGFYAIEGRSDIDIYRAINEQRIKRHKEPIEF